MRGLGFRIEDDLACVDGAIEVLTDNFPKDVATLEAYMRGLRRGK